MFTYVLSIAAQVQWLVTGKGDIPAKVRRKETVIAGLALLFAIWMIIATGTSTVYSGVILLLAGIPLYLVDRWWRFREQAKADAQASATAPQTKG